jgi:hypothetical protein
MLLSAVYSQGETGGVTTRTVTDTKLRHPIAGEKTPVLLHARTSFLFGHAFVLSTHKIIYWV